MNGRQTPGTRLRDLLLSEQLVVLPGASDALSARIVEAADSPATYITGFGVAAVLLGAPDAGLTSMDELVAHAGRIVDAVGIPVWCDIDQGWGPPHVVARTVRRCERAGVAGVDLDDQVTEACPYLPIRRELIPPSEMAAKLRVARDAAEDPTLVVTAKASVLNTRYEEDGSYREEFARRAELYVEAGADTVFTGWRTEYDLENYAKTVLNLGCPPVAIMGPFLPQVNVATLENMGYRAAIYPVDALYAASKAQFAVIADLLRHGDVTRSLPAMIAHDEFMALVGIDNLRDQLANNAIEEA